MFANFSNNASSSTASYPRGSDAVCQPANGYSNVGYQGAKCYSDEDDESDALYDEAVHYVTKSRRASISSVQRKLRIGYNRAARLIETMEAVDQEDLVFG